MTRRWRTSGGGFTFADGMTPMIDVVFLLMIFFLAVARLSEARLIRVDLPKTETGTPAALTREPDAVVVNVPADSEAFVVIDGASVDGDVASIERAIGVALDRSMGVGGEGVVWVRADRAADSGVVVRSIAAAERVLGERGGGVVRFASVGGER